MVRYDFFGTLVEVDEDATRSWYAKASKWGCECGHCRNFLLLAQQRKFPSLTLQALDAFDIPPEKATYVGQLYPTENGDCYQFSYRIAGTILTQGTDPSPLYDAGMGICTHETYPYGAPDFPTPHFDLEFSLKLPWVLEEPHHG